MIDYLYEIRNMVKRCEEFKKDILGFVFKDKDVVEPSMRNYCYLPRYYQQFEPIKRVIDMCELVGIRGLEINKDYLQDKTQYLQDPVTMQFKEFFVKCIDDIEGIFKTVEKEITEKISKLDKIETDRLNEAIHTFFERCFYSTVAMSVSAVERRLLKMMITVKPEKKEKLGELTLGQLVAEYLRDRDEYKRIVPERHETLLHLCNRYRISAVHPKGEEITIRVANSILNLTFEFLLEEH